MGFIIKDLNFDQQDVVETLENDIVSTFRIAGLFQGGYNVLSKQWFGDESALWVTKLQCSLNRMAIIIATKSIHIFFLKDDGGYRSNAATAFKPRSGWKDYTSDEHYDNLISSKKSETFSIGLDTGWYGKPPHCQFVAQQSQFIILVHELILLLMGKKDDMHHYYSCLGLANTNSRRAKGNTDNWTFFVDAYWRKNNYGPQSISI